MVKAEFLISNGKTTGFNISGHSGYSDSGSDIVCAAVSSAVMLIANAITENFKIRADIRDNGNEISLNLLEESEFAFKLLDALREHLGIISNQFSGTINIENMEV